MQPKCRACRHSDGHSIEGARALVIDKGYGDDFAPQRGDIVIVCHYRRRINSSPRPIPGRPCSFEYEPGTDSEDES